MTPERYKRIVNVLDARQADLTVVTDQVHKQRNLAAIIRTCDAVGVDTVHCVVPKEGFQTYSGTAASANKWVYTKHYADIIEPLTKLRAQGHQILAAVSHERAIDYREVDYCKATAIVMGAEINGVSREAESFVDQFITLPMMGMVESYNVSVACAGILMCAQGQRQQRGLYGQRKLSEALYRERYFHWAHPKIAKFCDDRQIPYPPIREDGEIEDLSAWFKSVQK